MVNTLQAFLKKFITTTIATLMVVFCFGVGVSYGQSSLVEYFNIEDDEGTTARNVATGISGTNLALSAGGVQTGSAQATSWTRPLPYAQGSSGWGVDNSESAKNFNFTINTDGADSFTLTELSFEERATGAGPSAITVTINGIEVFNDDVEADDTRLHTIDLTSGFGTDFEDITEAVVLIKGWDNESRTTGGGGQFRVNGIIVEGTVDLPGGPSISHTELDNTTSTSARTATATITGDNLITTGDDRPSLWYRVDGGSFTHTYFASEDGNEFDFTIPGQSPGSTVEYYLAAKDDEGVSTLPSGGEDDDPPGSAPPSSFFSYEIEFEPATRTWTGGASTSDWNDADNWDPAAVPGEGDDVVLDNSVETGSYSVILPSGDVTTTVESIEITPGTGNEITLVLPSDNTANPGLDITGDGDALVINEGGIFRNSSGASAGSGFVLSGDDERIRINDGGRYIHNTIRAHAGAIVAKLSTESGTENGIFEFDVPTSGTYSPSVTNRNYGTLELSDSGDIGVTYTLSGAGTLTLRGDFIVNTTTESTVNLISFNGNETQSISGAGTLQLFNSFVTNLRQNNSTSVVLNRAIELKGDLTLNDGSFNANGNLTLLPEANVIVDGGTLNGNFTMQHHLTGSEDFRMLSAPSGASLEDFLSPIWTQGATDGADTDQGNPNVFTWDNSSTDGSSTNWSGVTDLTGNLTAGSGILVYVFDKDDFDDPESDIWPKTLLVSGTEHGETTPSVNQNDGGFTLLGNPFVTTIDFNDLITNDLTDVAYVWDPGETSWKTWDADGNSGDLTDGLISPFQSFFVQSDDGSPSVEFTNAARSSGGSFLGKENEQQRNIVRLELNGEELRNSTWLRFSDAGSTDSQVRGDALQLEPLSENFAKLATEKSGTLFDISHLPASEEEYSIPVHISSTMSGSYTLTATDFELPEGFELTFHDHSSGTSVPLNADFSYTVEVAQAAKAAEVSPLERVKQGPVVAKASVGSPEYSITVSSGDAVSIGGPEELPQRVALNQNYPNPFNPSTVISYDLPEASDVTIQVYDMTGRQVATLVNSRMEAGTHEVTFNAGNLASGVYIYRLQAGEHMLTRKLTLIK